MAFINSDWTYQPSYVQFTPVDRNSLKREIDVQRDWDALFKQIDEMRQNSQPLSNRKFTLINGSYIGDKQNELPNGKGDLLFQQSALTSSHLYEGEWKNGKPNGKGIDYYTNNSIRYDGEWLDGKPHGWGERTQHDGIKIRGTWNNGKLLELDVCTWPDGTKYKGPCKDGRPHGRGEMFLNDSRWFKGEWDNGQLRKIFDCWPPGAYVGETKNGQANGYGAKHFGLTVGIYIGFWSNGKQHGEGKWINPQDKQEYYTGTWNEGNRHGVFLECYGNTLLYKSLYENGWLQRSTQPGGKEICVGNTDLKRPSETNLKNDNGKKVKESEDDDG